MFEGIMFNSATYQIILWKLTDVDGLPCVSQKSSWNELARNICEVCVKYTVHCVSCEWRFYFLKWREVSCWQYTISVAKRGTNTREQGRRNEVREWNIVVGTPRQLRDVPNISKYCLRLTYTREFCMLEPEFKTCSTQSSIRARIQADCDFGTLPKESVKKWFFWLSIVFDTELNILLEEIVS